MGGIENARHLMILAQQEGLSLDGESDRLGQFLEHPHYGPGAYALLRGWDNHRMYRMTSIDTYDDDFPDGKRARVFGGLSLTAEARARAQLPAHACTLVEVQIDDEIRFADADTAPALASIKPLLGQGDGEFKLYKLNMRCEQRRVPACRLRLSDEVDELGLPIPELNWLVSDEDHEAYHQTLIQIGAALGKSGLGRLYTPMSHGRVYSPDPPEGGWHHMGTTPMSESPMDGVVDKDCRLHALDNLYIAGSSVFPTGGYVNPTLTIVALAHRLSEHLIISWGIDA